MKTLADIEKTLRAFEEKYKVPVVGSTQGTEVWLKMKLGVLSASNASKIVAKRDSETRLTYLTDLVSEVCTGIHEELNSKHLDWGKQHEAAARSSYEFETGETMTQVAFVYKDESFREGCSPDGIMKTKGAEIKCPWDSANYVKFLVADKIKSEWQWQHQYTLRIMQTDSWDFVQYDPRMKRSCLKILTVGRDEEKQKAFDDLVPAFIEDMDKMLSKIGINFGEQWTR